MKVKSESEVAQLRLSPSDHMDGSPPDSSVHGLFQARVLEWVAIAFSNHRRVSWKDGPWDSHPQRSWSGERLGADRVGRRPACSGESGRRLHSGKPGWATIHDGVASTAVLEEGPPAQQQ